MVIVVEHLNFSRPQNAHRGSLDAFILSKEHYKDQLEAHFMQVLVTLWLPQKCILQQTFDPRTSFEFSERKLIISLTASRERDLKIAEKHFRKGNSSRAKKVLVHCIRYLDLGVQMKSVGERGILDYSSPNRFREQVLSDYSQKWEELMVSVQCVLDDLWSKLVK